MRVRATLFLVWLALLSAAFAYFYRYEHTPGAPSEKLTAWPADSTFIRRPGTSTLLVFIHPKCSCSYATLKQLHDITSRVGDRTEVIISFLSPKNKGANWKIDRNLKLAQSIPNTRVVFDDGTEIDRFDANTSGQTFLFDVDGKILFNGGITPSRAHVGENDGTRVISDFLKQQPVQGAKTSVFGCSMHNRVKVGQTDHD